MSDTDRIIACDARTDDEESGDIEINDYTEDPDGAEEEPVMEAPFNPTEINIYTKQESLHNIIERMRQGNEINMASEFQRHEGLWTPRQMSRLIESILIRFPLPAFYIDASDDDRWQVVDGLQRLSSIKRFVVEKDRNKRLRLRGLEYLQELNGKTFDELPRGYQRRIDECTVTLFMIQKGTPEYVKYSIFHRINTGGLTLNDQEIRNAMSSSSLRQYLRALATDKYLVKTIGDHSMRMLDQELVLRFLSFHTMDYEKEKKNITSFLDDMVGKLEKATPDDRDRWGGAFRLSIKRCWDLFADAAFEKRTDHEEPKHKRKNSTLFEVWTVALACLSEEQMSRLVARRDMLQERHIAMMSNDNDYFRSITFATQKREHFRIRRDKIQILIQEVLDA